MRIFTELLNYKISRGHPDGFHFCESIRPQCLRGALGKSFRLSYHICGLPADDNRNMLHACFIKNPAGDIRPSFRQAVVHNQSQHFELRACDYQREGKGVINIPAKIAVENHLLFFNGA